MEGKAAAGAEINLTDYGMLTDRLGRTFHRLGLKRQQRDVTPTLGDLIKQDQEAQRACLAQHHDEAAS
jgi:hypothetical protein